MKNPTYYKYGDLYFTTDIPIIENIHQKVYEAASAINPDTGENGLGMYRWHSDCGTTHCRAGWVVMLAGEKGEALEAELGTPEAAALIYRESDETLDRTPNFYTSNDEALADMKRLAELEAAR